MDERAGDVIEVDDRTALRLVRNELKWTRTELEHQAEALQRVRRQRAKLREQSDSLAAALAAELSAAYWRDRDQGRAPLRRRGKDPEAELVRAVEAHPLFDAGWYLRQHQRTIVEKRIPPALHHVRHANERKLDPSEGFSTARYLNKHPEATGSGLPALLHAERHGRLEDGAVDVPGAEG